MATLVELRGVSREFRGELVIDDLSLTLGPSGVTALVAPNAAGKTTLMSMISGLMSPTGGSVAYTDGDSPKDVALLLAGDKNLYMKNTVRENVLYFAALNGHGREEVRNGLPGVYEWFPELGSLWNDVAETLSYGQRRLVALASAVMAQNRYLLVDEAAEGLDVAHARRLADALRKMSEGLGVIVSSHDLRFVSEVADVVLFLRGGSVIREDNPSEPALRGRYGELFGGASQ